MELSKIVLYLYSTPNLTNILAKKVRKTKEQQLEGLKQFLNRQAKRMRNDATKWELILKKHLSDLHYNFKCQVPIIVKDVGFIVDYLIPEYNLIIECDGVSTHGSKTQQRKDGRRTSKLKKQGYHILRFWNKQISTFSKETIDQIIKQKIASIVKKD